ncbi:endonuclease domain-containing protein [Adhaeribacter swui]|uniref:Endonuclease domain-containing protein n=1 Tax=Adhaeribacter swui TaxID=2086471 RepID=A0A7G7G5K7_9BACT|nr:endonuclease domain-containing protein [Adhaeribacter swui]QNF32441.1 endonuclease domain-containing protein [Adhaeribacter swui]
MKMLERIHNQQNLKNLRRQNRSNLTPAEAELWKHLKNGQLGRKFRRQHSVNKYILDFYCPEEKLAIELDGKDHFTDNGFERDEERTKFLKNLNIKVLRFENKDVFEQLAAVLGEIKVNFTTPNPS